MEYTNDSKKDLHMGAALMSLLGARRNVGESAEYNCPPPVSIR